MKKPKSISNEHDVIRFLGRFPDKIMTKEEAKQDMLFKSNKWKCSACNTIFQFKNKVDIPVPCAGCGSIFFEKLHN